MSLGKRAYNLLRGYVSTEWERIRDVERDLAERELRASDLPPIASTPLPDETAVQYSVTSVSVDKKVYARRLLGVTEQTSFTELRKAFTRLNKRSDPANFPPGSVEADKAADIQRKVNWAYNVLTEDMDDTERRFRTLELD